MDTAVMTKKLRKWMKQLGVKTELVDTTVEKSKISLYDAEIVAKLPNLVPVVMVTINEVVDDPLMIVFETPGRGPPSIAFRILEEGRYVAFAPYLTWGPEVARVIATYIISRRADELVP
jgi:hypothetical protein